MSNQQPSKPSATFKQRFLRAVGWGIIILHICFIASQVGFVLWLFISSNESVNHAITNPNNQIVALVISDGCGATCRCTVRVDVKTDDRYYKEVWRGIDICDATITWSSDTEFTISAYGEQQKQIDIRTLGISPEVISK